jgi:two-component system OmpR family response regulator
LLVALTRAPGRVLDRSELVRRAYGDSHHITERTVDSHVRRIRAKLAAAGGDPVETVYGVGYRMREKL